ncbi:MAG: glycerophosphodiester phosphodiesterase [Deltaproteobacteria bacterium]|nr:MAG: glycerophosphodiester phosphodiesterase [Deltaproteobacteria bacterium]
MRHPYFDVSLPIPIGHRGAAGEAPENTLVSFERAVAEGAAILESDVHVTRDGEIVLLHDDTVDRTTDGHGRLLGLTLAEVKRLDAGYRFSADGGRSHPFRGGGVRIPTLDEAFAALPEARFNLEIKETDAGAIERVVGIVAEAGRAPTTLLTAASDPTMAALRAELRATGVAAALGASTGDVLGFVRGAVEGGEPPSDSMALQIPPSFGGDPLVTRELVAYAHRHGVQVHVWTINDRDEMARLLDLGVDGIISDFPGRVAALIAERRARA